MVHTNKCFTHCHRAYTQRAHHLPLASSHRPKTTRSVCIISISTLLPSRIYIHSWPLMKRRRRRRHKKNICNAFIQRRNITLYSRVVCRPTFGVVFQPLSRKGVARTASAFKSSILRVYVGLFLCP